MIAAERALDRRDRALDALLGLSLVAWAAVGLLASRDLPLGVRIALASVNALVGTLFVWRARARAQARPSDIVVALPSLVASGVAYRLAAHEWTLTAIVVHAAFALLALVSLATLGRSFAILPARRAIVARGAYRLVRHPIYLAELGMLVTACATRGWLAGVVAFVVVVALIAPRILAEERLLAEDAAYAAYRSIVRARLLPGLF